jgi:hypothetical protein
MKTYCKENKVRFEYKTNDGFVGSWLIPYRAGMERNMATGELISIPIKEIGKKLRRILYKNRDKISREYGYDKKLVALCGGVGSDCFWMIFKACGYDVKHVACGKMYDVWNIVKI